MGDLTDFKLPKQWRQWCRKARLTRHGRSGQFHHSWWYLKGHGRYWRVNDKGMFQCGDTYDEFDRWALCSIIEVPLPKTEREFCDYVAKLQVTRSG